MNSAGLGTVQATMEEPPPVDRSEWSSRGRLMSKESPLSTRTEGSDAQSVLPYMVSNLRSLAAGMLRQEARSDESVK
jgi:hypothetical protein